MSGPITLLSRNEGTNPRPAGLVLGGESRGGKQRERTHRRVMGGSGANEPTVARSARTNPSRVANGAHDPTEDDRLRERTHRGRRPARTKPPAPNLGCGSRPGEEFETKPTGRFVVRTYLKKIGCVRRRASLFGGESPDHEPDLPSELARVGPLSGSDNEGLAACWCCRGEDDEPETQPRDLVS